MKSFVQVLTILGCWVIAGCNTGVRDIDLESKQFEVTFDADSTCGIDTTNLEELTKSKAIYSFSKGGQGRQQTRMGMLSKENEFTWKVQGNGDSLRINNATYAIEKLDNGYKLRSDSAMIILSQQP